MNRFRSLGPVLALLLATAAMAVLGACLWKLLFGPDDPADGTKPGPFSAGHLLVAAAVIVVVNVATYVMLRRSSLGSSAWFRSAALLLLTPASSLGLGIPYVRAYGRWDTTGQSAAGTVFALVAGLVSMGAVLVALELFLGRSGGKKFYDIGL